MQSEISSLFPVYKLIYNMTGDGYYIYKYNCFGINLTRSFYDYHFFPRFLIPFQLLLAVADFCTLAFAFAVAFLSAGTEAANAFHPLFLPNYYLIS